MKVRAFIGKKEVQKEDLEKYTIKSETLNRILAEKYGKVKEDRYEMCESAECYGAGLRGHV